jgi:opacity protein-like surface antigen
MGRLLKTIVFGAIGLTMPAMAAMAADVPPPPYYPPPPPQASNWYLRFDGGFKFFGTPAASVLAPNTGYLVPGTGEFIDEVLYPGGLVSFGIGYDAPGAFRWDVTADYEWTDFFGRLVCVGCANNTEYSLEYAHIRAWTFLLNAYWDLQTNGAITPYIGAGIGASRLTTSSVYFLNPDGTNGVHTGASRWNLAWALMAGVTIEVNDRVDLDVGYKYVRLGTAVANADLTLDPGAQILYQNIRAHEVRFGVRVGLN